jgi:hypothetical protein
VTVSSTLDVHVTAGEITIQARIFTDRDFVCVWFPAAERESASIRIRSYLRVDEWRAGQVLCDGKRDEAEHGEAAVPELGAGGHGATAPRLGALPLEQRRHHVREPRLARPARDLRQEAVPARGGFHGERGHEADHGEPAVDALGCRPAERQRVPEARACCCLAADTRMERAGMQTR